MAAMTQAELTYIRSEVGDGDKSDDDLQELFDLYDGSTRSVILTVLRQRLANYMAAPADQSLSGVASLGTSANINGLRDQLKRLDAQDEAPPNPDQESGNTLTSAPWARRSTR